jgi:hypothetical protein
MESVTQKKEDKSLVLASDSHGSFRQRQNRETEANQRGFRFS